MNSPAEPTLHHRLLNELNALDSDLDGLDSILHVCSVALSVIQAEEANDASIVLANAARRVRTAQHTVTNAINLMPELLHVESRHE